METGEVVRGLAIIFLNNFATSALPYKLRGWWRKGVMVNRRGNLF